MPRLNSLPAELLFEDRFVLVADDNNAAVAHIPHGDVDSPPRLSADEFAHLPFVAVADSPHAPSTTPLLEAEGLRPRVDVVTEGFVVALLLLTETQLLTFIHARLGRLIADAAGLRLFEPPLDLGRVATTMSGVVTLIAIPPTDGCANGCNVTPRPWNTRTDPAEV